MIPHSLAGRRVLLVIAGGIAAYKALDLIRRLRERGCAVRCVMTAGATQFVTPLAAAALSEDRVYTDLFSLTDEAEMGHIRLSREADLILVAPATANLLAKVASGLADDLASTVLLASDKPILVAPAMNPHMWRHPATQANAATLAARGVRFAGPGNGDTACGEIGDGRMAEPLQIVAAVEAVLAPGPRDLAGRRALVTSGPTHEAIDPVRYIANRSSGKQGHAIAQALAARGAEVTLVTGPVDLPPPAGIRIVRVETALEMAAAVRAALPAEIAVCAAAVADWRLAEPWVAKMKKTGGAPPTLTMAENPDILATLSLPGPDRPALVVGFAAETEAVVAQATDKLRRKGCDWIVANDVSASGGVFGADQNQVHLLRRDGDSIRSEDWPKLTKQAVAERLAAAIADQLAGHLVGR